MFVTFSCLVSPVKANSILQITMDIRISNKNKNNLVLAAVKIAGLVNK